MNKIFKNLSWLVCFAILLLSCNQDKEEFKTDRIVVRGNILNYDKQKADFTYNKYELLSSRETSEVQFDTLGNIIDANAPRPSDSGLIELFNEYGIWDRG